MAAAYRKMLGVDIEVVSGPNLIESVDYVVARADTPCAVRIGYANQPKGYHFPGVIPLVRSMDPQVRFRIHDIVEGSDCVANWQAFRAVSELPNVMTSNDVLDAADYQAWMQQADLILLPYDPVIYKTRGSGVFNEAIRLSIPTVVTKGCEFAADAFAEGYAQPIEQLNAEGIAAAALQAVKNVVSLRTRARPRAAVLHGRADPISAMVRKALAALEK
jgi:hypothetical protein